jgi:hypothetical protein
MLSTNHIRAFRHSFSKAATGFNVSWKCGRMYAHAHREVLVSDALTYIATPDPANLNWLVGSVHLNLLVRSYCT